MKPRRPFLPGFLPLAFAVALPIALAGCGASNPNETEFLNSAPPGEQAKEEKFSERRARTHTLSKIELRNQAAAEKAAVAKKP